VHWYSCGGGILKRENGCAVTLSVVLQLLLRGHLVIGCYCAVLNIVLIHHLPIIMTGKCLNNKVEDQLVRERQYV
jgi:hypothetical protein